METSELSAPCVTVITHQTALQDVFLHSQGLVVCRLKGPTQAINAVKLLLGAYFLFDIKYPAYYVGLLNFLSNHLIGIKDSSKKNSLTYINFNDKYEDHAVQ